MIRFKELVKLVKNKIRGAPREIEQQAEQPISVANNKINIKIKSQNQKAMSMFNYGVGGNEVKVDANEAIQEIQENKTLLVSKLTTEDTISPEVVKGLKTVEDVFNHFRPTIAVNNETADGETVNESFSFNNIGDFTPKSLIKHSEFLNNQNLEQEQYNTIIRQLRNNKVLNSALTNPEAKAEFIEVLRAVASELEKK